MIEVSHLKKQYGSFTAVDDLSFTIEKGHIYGFLGPNGAGKSTTMNILTGCLAATSGDVKIDGFDIFEQPKEAKKRIGYLPEIPPLYTEQTVAEYLEFVAMAKGVAKADREDEIDRAMEETHIEQVANKLIGHLSKGYRQRVGIAQALIGGPEMIILDEPTVGLDPMQIIEIRDLIRKLGETHTVILSSHILSEIQAVCDMVLIIHKGRLIAFDKIENLSSALNEGNRVDLIAEGDPEKLRTLLETIPEIRSVRLDEPGEDGSFGAELSVGSAEPKAVCRSLFLACAREGLVLLQLNPVKVTLEDIFIELTAADTHSGIAPQAADEKEAEA